MAEFWQFNHKMLLPFMPNEKLQVHPCRFQLHWCRHSDFPIIIFANRQMEQ